MSAHSQFRSFSPMHQTVVGRGALSEKTTGGGRIALSDKTTGGGSPYARWCENAGRGLEKREC